MLKKYQMTFLGAWKLAEEPGKWQKEGAKNVPWEISKREARKKMQFGKKDFFIIIL